MSATPTTPTRERVVLPIQGMTCASCATRVEGRLNDLEGVEATVNYATERATVDYDPKGIEPERFLEAVASAGYSATLPEPTAAHRASDDAPAAGTRRRGHCAGGS